MTPLTPEEEDQIVNGIERMRPFIEAISKLLAAGKTTEGARDTRELIVETNENWGLHDDE